MGITFAKLFQRLFSKKEMRILMVRDVLRSRDGFGSRSACRMDGSFFFFRFFFSFRVNDERETTTGTTALMHFESRCRPGIFRPERRLDATRLRAQKVFD